MNIFKNLTVGALFFVSLSANAEYFYDDFSSGDLSAWDYVGEVLPDSEVVVKRLLSNRFFMRDTASEKIDGEVGKAYVSHYLDGNLVNGDSVTIESQYYIPVDFPVTSGSVYLSDIECSDCGIDTNPGIRLYIDSYGYLRINLDKLGGFGSINSYYPVPTYELFDLKWSVTLGDENTGHVDVYINDNKILDVDTVTMPLLSNLPELLTTDNERLNYFQIGLTANSRSTSERVWVNWVEMISSN